MIYNLEIWGFENLKMIFYSVFNLETIFQVL